MGVKVKICGITNLEDAQKAVDSGADALGFIFYKKSPRYITQAKAASIIKELPKKVIKIGVFVDAREQTIRKTAKLCSLDLIQLHGEESAEFCNKLNDLRIIKAFKVKSNISPEEILKYDTFAYLFDAYSPGQAGGTGKSFDWKFVEHSNCITRPIFLSGGLHDKNVKDAVKALHPHWVDVSSGVELHPGKKDHQKIQRFITVAKS